MVIFCDGTKAFVFPDVVDLEGDNGVRKLLLNSPPSRVQVVPIRQTGH